MITMFDIYHIQWAKLGQVHQKVLLDSKPVGYVVKSPDGSFIANVSGVLGEDRLCIHAVEKAVRRFDPMASVRWS